MLYFCVVMPRGILPFVCVYLLFLIQLSFACTELPLCALAVGAQDLGGPSSIPGSATDWLGDLG